MIPIPAIDIKNGKVVRLLQGNFSEEKIYFDKPEEVARHFQNEGAQRIHVVDLEGALGGTPKNAAQVEKILKAVSVPVELGGGIRSLEAADFYLKMGVGWVIFGTQACLDHGFTQEAIAAFGSRAIIGIDALNGQVATDAWTKVTDIKAVDLARKVEQLGGTTIIYTDISKDGVLKGPNLDEIKRLSRALSIQVIASGGIGSLEDVQALMGLKENNISGVIIGKALYEKKFTVREVVQQCLQNA